MTEIKHITLATAGHIDHGKTALVKALTGTDTDRLAEEKERGMTIDLGFAFLPLPSANTVSIVDVPGHEKFVKTMVAGVSGIDFVILVIALDEGIMPQTKEHINILSIMGMDKGLVALTKKDLVSVEIINSRKEEVSNYLKNTPLKDLPIFPVSSVTRDGVEDILSYIDKLISLKEGNNKESIFRMPIDRVFTMPGHGTVVTGTILSGKIEKGQFLELLPQGITAKVRNVQVRNESVNCGVEGDRCALNLASLEKDEISRGTVAAERGKLSVSRLLDAVVFMARGQGTLKHNQRVHFHTGTAVSQARIRILGQEEIGDGEKGYIQIRLESPLPVLKGDKYILRSFSPVITLGGGSILLHKTKHRKHKSQGEMDTLMNLEEGKSDSILGEMFNNNKKPLSLAVIKEETGIPYGLLEDMILSLLKKGVIIKISAIDKYLDYANYEDSFNKLEKAYYEYGQRNPFRFVMPREEARSKVFPDLSSKEAAGILNEMEKEGKISLEGDKISIAQEERIKKINGKKEVETIKTIFEKQAFTVSSFNGIIDESHFDKELADQILRFLIEIDYLKDLGQGNFSRKEDLLEAYRISKEYIDQNGKISVGELRDLLQAGRKAAIAYLEYFDSLEVTERIDNYRQAGKNLLKSP